MQNEKGVFFALWGFLYKIMDNRIIIFSDQPYARPLNLISIKEIKEIERFKMIPIMSFSKIVFVAVNEETRKNIEYVLELLQIDSPIVDFADYVSKPLDHRRVLGEEFTFSSLKKFYEWMFGDMGALVPA